MSEILLPKVWRSAETGRYYKMGRERTFEAQLIQPGDIADVEVVTILDEVLGLARPQYRLRGMCRPVRMDKLQMRVDLATALTGREKVPPLVEAEISAEAYSKVDFDLWKNVVHVAISDEAIKRAAHDILALHVDDAAMEISRMENKQIAEAAEAGITEKVPGVVYADWGAVTGGVSDTNPLEAVLASADYILGKGYGMRGLFLALHPTLWRRFLLNTWIRELVESGVMRLGEGGFSLPSYPGFRVIVDPQLTETPTGSVGPMVGSLYPPGILFGEGPVEAAKYRDEKIGYTGYIIRQWLEPKVVLNDCLDIICT